MGRHFPGESAGRGWMSSSVRDVLAAQANCLAAIEAGEPETCHTTWQAYDQLVRMLSTDGVAPSELRSVLDGHFSLEIEARRARDQLVESQQTVSRQRTADRAYRAHE